MAIERLSPAIALLLVIAACSSSGEGPIESRSTSLTTGTRETIPETIEATAGDATIRIDTSGMDQPPELVAKVVDLTMAEVQLPEWGAGIETLYRFSVDQELATPAEVRIPIPAESEIAILAHFDKSGDWLPVPFEYDGDLAVAAVDDLSEFAFINTSVRRLEDFLAEHPWIDVALGGSPSSQGPLCGPDDAPADNSQETPSATQEFVEIDLIGDWQTVGVCSRIGPYGREIRVRNEREFLVDVYPNSGADAFQGGLFGSCCEDGLILGSGQEGVWLWSAGLDRVILTSTFDSEAGFWTGLLLVSRVVAYFLPDVMPLLGALYASNQIRDIVSNAMGSDPSGPEALRDLADLLANDVFREKLAEIIHSEELLAKAGVHTGLATLKKLLLVPQVAGDVRLLADLLYGADAEVTVELRLTSTPAETGPLGVIGTIRPERIDDPIGDDELEVCVPFSNEGDSPGEFKVFFVADGGAGQELDVEPDTYWLNLPPGDSAELCLTTNWKVPSIRDVGDRYMIALQERSSGVADTQVGVTP